MNPNRDIAFSRVIESATTRFATVVAAYERSCDVRTSAGAIMRRVLIVDAVAGRIRTHDKVVLVLDETNQEWICIGIILQESSIIRPVESGEVGDTHTHAQYALSSHIHDTYALVAHSHDYSAVYSAIDHEHGYEAIYAAITHPHAWADITSGLPDFATRWPAWGEVTDKPTTFTPSAHDHVWADITDAPELVQTHTIYVSKAGSDTNGGQEAIAPKLSIGSAITAASALLTGGATGIRIEVMDGGTYTESFTLPRYVTLAAPSATVVGTISLESDTTCHLNVHYAASNNDIMVSKVGASGQGHYFVNWLDGRGVSGTLTGCTGIRNNSSGSVIFARVGVLFVSADGVGIRDQATGFGHIHFWAADLYLAGNNAIGIQANSASTNIIGYIDHILEVSSPTGTIGISLSNASAIVKATITEIIADTVYNIAAGSLHLVSARVSGVRTGTPIFEISDAMVLPSARGGTGVSNAGTLTLPVNTTINGGGTVNLGGFTFTVGASGTASLVGHFHAWSDITSGVPDYATRWPTWSEVTSKPTTFAYTDAANKFTQGQEIETTNPILILDTVADNAYSGLRFQEVGSTRSGVNQIGNVYSDAARRNGFEFFNSVVNGFIGFWVNSGAGTVEKVRITANGSVGVNVTVPTSQLHVLSGAVDRIGLLVDTPASPTVDLFRVSKNASPIFWVDSTGIANVKIESYAGTAYTSGVMNMHHSTAGFGGVYFREDGVTKGGIAKRGTTNSLGNHMQIYTLDADIQMGDAAVSNYPQISIKKTTGHVLLGKAPTDVGAVNIKNAAVGEISLVVDAVTSTTAHLLSLRTNAVEQFAINPAGQIRTNQAAATTSGTDQPSATAPYRMPIYNIAGTLLGYVPIYSTWT